MKNAYAWADPLRDELVKGSEFIAYESLEFCCCAILIMNASMCEWPRGYHVQLR